MTTVSKPDESSFDVRTLSMKTCGSRLCVGFCYCSGVVKFRKSESVGTVDIPFPSLGACPSLTLSMSPNMNFSSRMALAPTSPMKRSKSVPNILSGEYPNSVCVVANSIDENGDAGVDVTDCASTKPLVLGKDNYQDNYWDSQETNHRNADMKTPKKKVGKISKFVNICVSELKKFKNPNSGVTSIDGVERLKKEIAPLPSSPLKLTSTSTIEFQSTVTSSSPIMRSRETTSTIQRSKIISSTTKVMSDMLMDKEGKDSEISENSINCSTNLAVNKMGDVPSLSQFEDADGLQKKLTEPVELPAKSQEVYQYDVSASPAKEDLKWSTLKKIDLIVPSFRSKKRGLVAHLKSSPISKISYDGSPSKQVGVLDGEITDDGRIDSGPAKAIIPTSTENIIMPKELNISDIGEKAEVSRGLRKRHLEDSSTPSSRGPSTPAKLITDEDATNKKKRVLGKNMVDNKASSPNKEHILPIDQLNNSSAMGISSENTAPMELKATGNDPVSDGGGYKFLVTAETGRKFDEFRAKRQRLRESWMENKSPTSNKNVQTTAVTSGFQSNEQAPENLPATMECLNKEAATTPMNDNRALLTEVGPEAALAEPKLGKPLLPVENVLQYSKSPSKTAVTNKPTKTVLKANFNAPIGKINSDISFFTPKKVFGKSEYQYGPSMGKLIQMMGTGTPKKVLPEFGSSSKTALFSPRKEEHCAGAPRGSWKIAKMRVRTKLSNFYPSSRSKNSQQIRGKWLGQNIVQFSGHHSMIAQSANDKHGANLMEISAQPSTSTTAQNI
ncbi:Dentin sialophosphoprotein-like [Caenorhabditis elegans]|uniref:Dentin sialophosphoprotein-like n=1 Tax=Caenorhabditis elegans TaxID=6239 RepID=O17684_CAEEL|nr:Dentin sialophosphoprotein-like [Caenorhabditis elegans]CAB03979.1 Dentin sialophosphoprotein-like [Caenorhabditis elegans]|eukprot:NP_510007.1 Uncharacterized protein CELE_C49F5.6 [Caenorhabditis elegans]